MVTKGYFLEIGLEADQGISAAKVANACEKHIESDSNDSDLTTLSLDPCDELQELCSGFR